MFTKNNLIRLFFCKHQHGGKIVGIKFYTVSDEYIDYCRKIEKKVPKNVDESTGFKKPHIGIMIQNSEHYYFVQLTSNKERYDHFREDYTFHFIRDLSYIDKQNPDNEKKIAGLRIGYMFPVPECALQPLEFNSIEDKEYKSLVWKEWIYCKENIGIIESKANKLYNLVTKHKQFKNRCCDFKRLELRALEFVYAKEEASKK